MSSDGYRVRVAGLPFAEDVDPDHLYWVQQKRAKVGFKRFGSNVDAQWIEARHLIRSAHEIGTPIDMTEERPPAVPVARNLGGGVSSRKTWTVEEYPLLDEPEWWWVIGYWLGDGNLRRSHRDGHPMGITLTVADDDGVTLERLVELFAPRGWGGVPLQRVGCKQLVFHDESLAALLDGWLHYAGDARGKGKGRKIPPGWVERLPLKLQAELVRGLNAADGVRDTTEGAIISNTSLEMLLSVRSMLARLGVPSSIRRAKAGGPMRIQGRLVMTQPSYTIRFWRGAEFLGVEHRFHGKFVRPYIEAGYLWSRVLTVEPIPVLTMPRDAVE